MTKDENKEYVPFGLEWYKEMRKLNKDTIISLVEKNCKERDKLREQTKELHERVEQLQAKIDEFNSLYNKHYDDSECGFHFKELIESQTNK